MPLNPVVSVAERYMNALAARQKVVASNIANADTPGFRAKDVDFSSVLSGVAADAPAATEVQGLQTKPDGNNVSLDREARNLAENSLRFQIATQFVQHQIRLTRTAIQEGKA